MKTATRSVILILFALFLFSSAKATNYNNYGTFAAYTLNSGDTLRIQQGSFTGVIATLPSGAVIIIAPNASFSPSVFNLSSPAGKIINNGTAQFSALGIGGGFSFENYNIAKVNGDMSFYSGSIKSLVNGTGAKLYITGSLSANDNTSITNQGLISVGNAVNLYASSAAVTNKGLILAAGSFNNQGQVANENVIRVAGDFNYWGGQVNNTGEIEPSGNFSIGAGLTYVNHCRLITKTGINNYGTFQNNGLVWAGTSNTSSDQFTNSGSLINASYGKLRTATFTTYGTITGAGFIYATGQTTLGGGASIGITGVTTDSIRVYDVSRSNPSQIFDNQWGTVRPNVKYKTFAAPDSFEIFAGCSDVFKTSLSGLLPVNWNYFYVNLVQGKPLLYWSAEYEMNTQFQVERSYNNIDFITIYTTVSNTTASYSYTDVSADSKQVIYYRIKGTSADGSIKYSEIRFVKGSQSQSMEFDVYPNPSKGAMTLEYKAATNEQLIVRIKSVNGQQLSLRTVATTAGINRIELPETGKLLPGVYFIDVIKGNMILSSQKLVRQ